MKKILSILLIFCVFSKTAFADIFNDPQLAEKVGDKVQIAVPLYALFLTTVNNDFVKGGGQLALGMLSIQASVEILKRTVKEERPNKTNNLSFPSGHTAAAFGGATFIHKRYGFRQAVVPYILATYVGYSRVKSKMHHTHDVIAGMLIASGINYFLVDSLDNSQNISLENKKSGMILSYKKSF